MTVQSPVRLDTHPVATLSLDLDNLWSYLKTHGDAGWENYPSFLDRVVPRALDGFARHDLEATVFIVGRDAIQPANRAALAAIAAAGHEIGNHSFDHDQSIQSHSTERIDSDLSAAEEAIAEATGCVPRGFRGPGYSLSEALLDVLLKRGYRYDASTFPACVGPLARAYYFLSFSGSAAERRRKRHLFGRFRDGRRPLTPYAWRLTRGTLPEIPISALPFLRLPFHASYLFYLAQFSRRSADQYFRFALAACRRAGIAPTFLLHPTDFIGIEDRSGLDFFPGMRLPGVEKRKLLDGWIRELVDRFDVMPVGRYVERLTNEKALPLRPPDFAVD